MKEININIFLNFLHKNKIVHEFEIVQNELSVKIPLSDKENLQVELFDIYFEMWFPKCYYSETYENISLGTICNLVETIYYKNDVLYEEKYYFNRLVSRDVNISTYCKIEAYRIPLYFIFKKKIFNLICKIFNLQQLLNDLE